MQFVREVVASLQSVPLSPIGVTTGWFVGEVLWFGCCSEAWCDRYR
jgi:hypothetical protein